MTPDEAAGKAAVSAPETAAPAAPKAGRNLPAAIGAGFFLGGLVLACLLIRKEAFVVLACIASVVAVIELLGAMAQRAIAPPAPPIIVAAAALPAVAYVWGPTALASAAVLAILAVAVYGTIQGRPEAPTEVAAGALIVLYVPALVSFAMMLLKPDDGVERIVTFIVVTICSDIGGYAVGVVAGKHPMAPTVSPKKSWEGFAGSASACVIAGVLCVVFVLDGDAWVGVVLGLLVVVAATVGDLCESMIKRDLGVKDMSNLIPGHGGLMDRLDSLLLAAPVTWLVLNQWVG